jgi:hypothetical protein
VSIYSIIDTESKKNIQKSVKKFAGGPSRALAESGSEPVQPENGWDLAAQAGQGVKLTHKKTLSLTQMALPSDLRAGSAIAMAVLGTDGLSEGCGLSVFPSIVLDTVMVARGGKNEPGCGPSSARARLIPKAEAPGLEGKANA